MILESPRDGLLNACQLVSVAAATRTTKDVYADIKAVADHYKLTLLATNLEVGIRYELRGVEVREPGPAILPAAKLISILRESTDDAILIDADDRRCKVNTASSEYEMPSVDPGIFSDVAEFNDANHLELAAGDLIRMIRRTIFAPAKEPGKYPTIVGILWDLEGDAARLVATDGKRLALASGPVKTHGKAEAKAHSHVVPPRAMQLLERILGEGDADQPVRVSLRANDALFATDKATVYTRLVEGRFPAYRDLIPKKVTAKVPLPVEPFLAAIRQAAIMTDVASKRVTFRFGPGKLTLEAQGMENPGRSKVAMGLSYDGPEISIAFDPLYLTDMLKVLDPAEPLTLDLVDGQKAALFGPATSIRTSWCR